MNRKNWGLILILLVIGALVVWVQGWMVSLLWNIVLVPLVGFPTIGTIHGIAISILSGLFFDKLTRL